MNLRWVIRDGRYVLQLSAKGTYTSFLTWHDVPLMDEETGESVPGYVSLEQPTIDGPTHSDEDEIEELNRGT